jgi:hypothetical protein
LKPDERERARLRRQRPTVHGGHGEAGLAEAAGDSVMPASPKRREESVEPDRRKGGLEWMTWLR